MEKEELSVRVTTATEVAGRTLRSRYSVWGLAAISFVESALILPVITDPFLAAYILANKREWVRAVVVTTMASVVGGILAYFIAVGFFEVVVSPLVDESLVAEVHQIAAGFEEGTFILTLTGALTPVPYTLVAFAAGLVQASLLMFILASVVGRGARYLIGGWLVHRFGEYALSMVRKQILMATLFCIALIVIYIIIRVL